MSQKAPHPPNGGRLLRKPRAPNKPVTQGLASQLNEDTVIIEGYHEPKLPDSPPPPQLLPWGNSFTYEYVMTMAYSGENTHESLDHFGEHMFHPTSKELTQASHERFAEGYRDNTYIAGASPPPPSEFSISPFKTDHELESIPPPPSRDINHIEHVHKARKSGQGRIKTSGSTEKKYIIDPVHRQRTNLGTYVEGQSLLKTFKPRGPDPLPIRAPAVRHPPIVHVLPNEEDDYMRYQQPPEFTLQDFLVKVSQKEKVPIQKVEEIVYSKHNYKKLQNMLADIVIHPRRQKQVKTVHVAMPEELSKSTPRVPQKQLVLEMAALIKEQMSAVMNAEMRPVIKPLPKWSPDYKPGVPRPHTEIVLYEGSPSKKTRDSTEISIKIQPEYAQFGTSDSLFHSATARYFQGSRRSNSPFGRIKRARSNRSLPANFAPFVNGPEYQRHNVSYAYSEFDLSPLGDRVENYPVINMSGYGNKASNSGLKTSSRTGRINNPISVGSSLNMGLGDATPRALMISEMEDLENVPIGYSAGSNNLPMPAANVSSWDQYQPLPLITEGYGQDETYKLAAREIDIEGTGKMYLYRKDEGTVSELASFHRERSNLLSRDSELFNYEKQFSFDNKLELQDRTFVSSKTSFMSRVKTSDQRILNSRKVTQYDETENEENEPDDHPRIDNIPKRSQVRSFRSSLYNKSRGQSQENSGVMETGPVEKEADNADTEAGVTAEQQQQQLEALRSFVAEEGGEASNQDDGMISPSELAILDTLISGGSALSLKAHFICEMPDIEPLVKTITYLNLSFNDFRNVPYEVFEIENLTVLKLRNNPIREIPPEISKLKNLKTLVFSFCLVSTLPVTMFDLRKLEHLDMAYNRISFIPSEIRHLKRLRELNVEGNQLPAMPVGVMRLHNLRYVRVRNNFMHPLFWKDNAKNEPLSLVYMAALILKQYNLEGKCRGRVPKPLQDMIDSPAKCDCCKGPLYGPGLRMIRPVTRIFGIKNLPFMFRSCSPYCFNKFANSTENMVELLYGTPSEEQMK